MPNQAFDQPILPATLEEAAFINEQIDEFNARQLAFTGVLETPIRYVVKEGDTILAGIDSCFYLEEVLYVHVLFVDAKHRGQDLGSRLLKKVEEEAKGAKLVHLDTFDFQAKDFYLKYGYEIFGILEDCPKGHKRYYLRKSL